MTKPLVLIPIPNDDFDPSEVAVSWLLLTQAGIDVEFATPDGGVARGDPLMLTGEGLDVWGRVPLLRRLKLVGLMLRADARARAAYAQLERDANFQMPLRYAALDVNRYDGVLLPGGHAPRIKAYLESRELQSFVAQFFEAKNAKGTLKPVAAICHGVVLAARSVSPTTGRSVLHGLKTTALTWKLEHAAELSSRFVGRFWDRGYYRTYLESNDQPTGYCSVESEVKRALASETDFMNVPKDAPHFFMKDSGLWRDTPQDARCAWVVRDGRYLSARWPGDVHSFAAQFAQMVNDSA